MFYGKAVKYAENGIERDAIVFHQHFGLESHQGVNGEPLVHIVFPDPAKENLNLADPMLKMIVRHDVAHASHEFTEEEAKKYGEIFAGGRYHESRSPLEVVAEVAKAKADRLEAAKLPTPPAPVTAVEHDAPASAAPEKPTEPTPGGGKDGEGSGTIN